LRVASLPNILRREGTGPRPDAGRIGPGVSEMTGETPTFVPVQIGAEIDSYQEDFDDAIQPRYRVPTPGGAPIQSWRASVLGAMADRGLVEPT